MTNIFLIGYMGSGKTETGKALQKLTGLPLLDMDEMMEREQGCSIPAIFQRLGEAGFRQIESGLLLRLCRCPKYDAPPVADGMEPAETEQPARLSETPLIISCGGGVVERPENIELLHANDSTFFLHGSPELLFSRIKNDTNRPNARADISDETERFSHLRSLYNKREALYRKASSHTIEIEGKSPEEIAAEILTYRRSAPGQSSETHSASLG